MFCIIQEIITKRENPPGFPKRLEVTHYATYAEDGTEQIKWGYVYSDECFERPVKKSYKVSVHQSYRDRDGKPRKKEFVLFTVKYYDLATGEFDTYNWGAEKIEKVAAILGVSEEEIYKAVESKIRPLELELQEEFQQTEESQAYRRNLKIVLEYERKKRQFNIEYMLEDNDDRYDYCYDVFGKLRNPAMLKQIQKEYKERRREEKERQKKFEEWFHEYNWNQFQKNHSGSGSYQNGESDNYQSSDENRSYYNYVNDNYTDEEKVILKQFYRVLAKKFHPDSNAGKDTTKQMALLNKLHSQWGLG